MAQGGDMGPGLRGVVVPVASSSSSSRAPDGALPMALLLLPGLPLRPPPLLPAKTAGTPTTAHKAAPLPDDKTGSIAPIKLLRVKCEF
jgi:hypothetical protein